MPITTTGEIFSCVHRLMMSPRITSVVTILGGLGMFPLMTTFRESLVSWHSLCPSKVKKGGVALANEILASASRKRSAFLAAMAQMLAESAESRNEYSALSAKG